MSGNFYDEAKPLLLAVDCIIFGFAVDKLRILLFRRKVKPFQQEWSLIGSFVNENESVADAATRILEESTGLKNVFLQELSCYGAVERDPGARVVSIAHFALMQITEPVERLADFYQAQWFDADQLPDLILDHGQMVAHAKDKLLRKARYEPIGFELLPEKFTIPQLKSLYDAIYQEKLDRRNFRRKILTMGILEKLDEKDKKSSRKGAFLYRFNLAKYQELVATGFNFEL